MGKNFLFLILSALLIVIPNNSSAFSKDGLEYKIISSSDLTCEVSSAYRISGGIVNIPATVTYNGKDYKVIGIGNRAFKNGSIKELNIAEGITYIGTEAFYKNAISKIVIPSSVNKIGLNAFKDANKANSIYKYGEETELIIKDSEATLTGEVEMGEWQEYIYVGGTLIWQGENPYYRQPFHYVKLKKVYIGRNIGPYVISDALCEFTEELIIGDKVTNLQTSHLTWERNDPADLANLKTLTIGKGLSYVPSFMESSRLKEIYVRASKPQASQGFKSSTYSSTTLYVPRGTKSLYQKASVWSKFLKIVEYDVQGDENETGEETEGENEGETEGETSTYNGLNYKLELTDYGAYVATVIKPDGAKYEGSITIPKTIERNGQKYTVYHIGDEAFAGCDITSVTFEGHLTTIGYKAFYACHGLSSLTIPDGYNIKARAFEGCYNLSSIDIHEGVSSIGARAFAGCKKITSITLPKSLTSMGDNNKEETYGYVFDGCSNLTTIIINTEGISSLEWSMLYSGPVFANLSKIKDIYCSSLKMPYIISISDYISYSDFFKKTDISNATLHVPSSMVELYKTTAPWSGFGNITDDMTGINGIKVSPSPSDGTVYDLMGRKLKEPRKGINIINGKKVFFK